MKNGIMKSLLALPAGLPLIVKRLSEDTGFLAHAIFSTLKKPDDAVLDPVEKYYREQAPVEDEDPDEGHNVNGDEEQR
jgi:hypothetical protein